MPNASRTFTPIPAGARLEALDIIRGFALLGVLQLNLTYFSGTSYLTSAQVPFDPGPGGATLIWLRTGLLAGKSIALFSMLFGIGLGIQMERARQRPGSFGGFVLRRLGTLLLLGAAHAALIWNGDILHVYALGGLLILPFLGRPAWVPLTGAGILFALGILRSELFTGLHIPMTVLRGSWDGKSAWVLRMADQAYGQGTWLQAAEWRIREWLATTPEFLTQCFFGCVPLFLLGLALWRWGILRDPQQHLGALRSLFHATFWPGLLLSFACVPLMAGLRAAPGGEWAQGRTGDLVRALTDAATYALALGYLLGLLVLLQRPGWQAILRPLAPMGRMALSNYLSQSLICAWMFNGHGLGLWTRVAPSAYILAGLALFVLQVAWSRWWLARFRFGPLEWLWRMLSYARLEPLRAGPGDGR